jgi:Zn-dependent M28 family amino/carboxypeptidase
MATTRQRRLVETIKPLQFGLKTRRSILFAFWDGEERNLRGSKYWLAHPTIPGEHVKLAITSDMIGRLRDGQLYVLGTRSGYGLRQLMSGPVEDPLWLDFNWDLSANSDHWSFLEHKVPVVLLHSGMHSDYHRPSDDVEKINREGMREVSRYLLARDPVANADSCLSSARPDN